MLNQWFCAADVSHEFILKDIKRPESIINCSNPFWKAMTVAAGKLKVFSIISRKRNILILILF